MALTFAECVEMVGRSRRGEKRLSGRSTTLYKVDDYTFAVRYHNTDVVLIHDDGSYTLNSGGYHTVTTKARMSEYAPNAPSQMKFVWYICGQEFKDGVRIDSAGHIIDDLNEYHLKTGYKESVI
jgi:hypothetical protein